MTLALVIRVSRKTSTDVHPEWYAYIKQILPLNPQYPAQVIKASINAESRCCGLTAATVLGLALAAELKSDKTRLVLTLAEACGKIGTSRLHQGNPLPARCLGT